MLCNWGVDTSVFGGLFDKEFEEPTFAFFDLVRAGRFELLVSDVSRKEIAGAPQEVQELFESMVAFMRLIPVDGAVLALRDALSRRWDFRDAVGG